MAKHRSLIKNFPRNYPLSRKILANAIFLVGTTVIYRHYSHLKLRDFIRMKSRLRVGDVVLVGDLRTISRFFIGAKVTHTLFYVGDDTFVHAVGPGVKESSMEVLFTEYDTMMVLRPRTNKKVIAKAIKYAKSQVGKPYDFDFGEFDDRFHCSGLVHRAFREAGFDIHVSRKENGKRLFAKEMVRPADLIGKSFKIVYRSKSLKK